MVRDTTAEAVKSLRFMLGNVCGLGSIPVDIVYVIPSSDGKLRLELRVKFKPVDVVLVARGRLLVGGDGVRKHSVGGDGRLATGMPAEQMPPPQWRSRNGDGGNPVRAAEGRLAQTDGMAGLH